MQWPKRMVCPEGFEPTTCRVTAGCSTPELRTHLCGWRHLSRMASCCQSSLAIVEGERENIGHGTMLPNPSGRAFPVDFSHVPLRCYDQPEKILLQGIGKSLIFRVSPIPNITLELGHHVSRNCVERVVGVIIRGPLPDPDNDRVFGHVSPRTIFAMAAPAFARGRETCARVFVFLTCTVPLETSSWPK